MTDETIPKAEAAARVAAVERLYQEALIWCSGSADFAPDGIAAEGWRKLCKPLIDMAPSLDGSAALARLLAESKAEGMREAAGIAKAEGWGTKRFAESEREEGSRDCAERIAAAILAAADKVAET